MTISEDAEKLIGAGDFAWSYLVAERRRMAGLAIRL
jgi:hypothetical protein